MPSQLEHTPLVDRHQSSCPIFSTKNNALRYSLMYTFCKCVSTTPLLKSVKDYIFNLIFFIYNAECPSEKVVLVVLYNIYFPQTCQN